MAGAIRLILINLAVLAGLMLVAELGYRTIEFADSCLDHRRCSMRVWGPNVVGPREVPMQVRDPVLGFVSRPDVSMRIDDPASRAYGTEITTGAHGIRSNGAPSPDGPAVLAIGDSFTFGQNVSDHESWPACVERGLGRPVINAGVSGYGSAQAVLRGHQLVAEMPVDTVLLSILVARDLDRDRRRYLNGFPHPAVVIRNGKIGQSAPAEDLSGTPWQADDLGTFGNAMKWLRRWSLVLHDSLGRHPLGGGAHRTEYAPDAARLEDVLAFTLDSLLEIPARHHVVLLQYTRRLDRDDTTTERALILEAAKARGIAVVDSFDAVRSEPHDVVWRGHHTVRGNEIVCQAVIESGVLAR